MSIKSNVPHIALLVGVLWLLVPIFVQAMTAQEYVDLVNNNRQQNSLPQLSPAQTNATITAWNSLTEQERLYVEQRVAAIQANNGNLPIGAAVGTIGSNFDQLTPQDQTALTEAAQYAAENPRKPGDDNPISCNGFGSFWSSPLVCIGRSISAFLAGALVFIAAWTLTVAGVLFNWILDKTVISFGGFVTQNVQSGIDTAWTAFRDISNIVIIGMFVFIAISIILGLKEFGQKKMVAKVLIIAVLINFSLLFTKMIIDASNFTALQFYNAASNSGVLPKVSSSGSTQIGASTAQQVESQGQLASTYGVAGAFMDFAGVSGFTDTFDATRKLADKLDNGFYALLHGIFTATLLLTAAVVLLYGSFLLIVRGILMIFLMITSALAFASYLIPKFASSGYGWSAWWSSLLKNAVFAPLLMLFLWATLNIASAMRTGSGGTLGDLISNPTKSVDMSALFTYIVVIGLLFASIKISSKFATTIGGFSMASLVPGTGLGLASMGARWLGRNTVGWAASSGLSALRGRDLAYQTQDGRWVGGASSGPITRFAATRLANLQKASFDALRTKPGGVIGQTFGVPKGFIGSKTGEGGFGGVMARKAKAADDKARAIGPTDRQRTEVRQVDERREATRRRERSETERNRQVENQRLIATLTANAERDARAGQGDERTQAERELADAIRDQAHATETHASDLRVAEQRAANAQDPDARRTANEDLTRLRAERRQAMEGEAQRIQTAQERATGLNTRATQAAAAALAQNPQVVEANRVLAEAAENLRRFAEEDRARSPRQVAEGREHGRDRALRESLLWDPRAAPKIEDEMRAHRRRQNWADLDAARRADQGVERAPAPAPQQPPAGNH